VREGYYFLSGEFLRKIVIAAFPDFECVILALYDVENAALMAVRIFAQSI
jgi:hypothetical protein